ncbi:MAG: HU family DNA-binding protein [Prevotella sp.]|nr:HU family DNA-binding protein [Prevotella sp.]
MNNKEFIIELARKTGYTQEDTRKLVRTFVDELGKNFENSEAVMIPGFGTFDIKKRMERTMVNPATGKRMLVPPKLVLNFKPVASIKEKLKNGGTAND